MCSENAYNAVRMTTENPPPLRRLAAEPYRVFFVTGILWSLVGAAIWPLFYRGLLPYYPSVAHARLMMEGFGGAFVVGFLGTAGPRMASAPGLTPAELFLLLSLHTGACACHLLSAPVAGDALFAGLLTTLLVALTIRVARHREEPPPPQLLLALVGLLCGIAGAAMAAMAGTLVTDGRVSRFGALLLNQGLLLAPTLGIGSFIFPRILGGGFGGEGTPAALRRQLIRTGVAATLLIASFGVEAAGAGRAGNLLRFAVCAAYLLAEVSWKRKPQEGTPATGLRLALLTGGAGLVLAAFADAGQRISVEHLLFIGGFGLMMLVVGARVLFGHSGGLAEFSKRSQTARVIVALALGAAVTRAIPAVFPQLTVTHHLYAAGTWLALATTWLVWNRRRFVEFEEE